MNRKETVKNPGRSEGVKKLRVGVVGVGHLGQHHARIYSQMPDVDLVGVADTQEARGKEISEKYKTKYFSNYLDLIPKVDALSIAVPTQFHYEVTHQCLQNGIDVLLEKPISATVEEAESLISEAGKNKIIFQIGHLERYNRAFLKIKGLIRNPRFIENHRIGPFAARGTDVNVILDLMIHDIDIILSLTASPLTEIRAVGIPVLSREVDIVNARLEFKSGCIANMTASRVSLEKMRKIRIFQPEAYISLDYQNQEVTIARKVKENDTTRIVVDHPVVEKEEPLKLELHDFVLNCLNRTAPEISGVEGKEALRVAEEIAKIAIQQSRKFL
ncbi:MAG: Gfo/Idh/MocA family oxidoreductase [Nitrospirae bacterium]|nr:Gfo/Idh/MocA family oxidoreductase [Nitrospirota bacterium]MBI3351892.1 Gfo/Idh/MocA family oxidoreductase [Nitrospirota bacterium]